MPYRHTQSGIVILVVCLAIGALTAAITWQTGLMPTIITLIILIAVAIIFYSLTVEVGDGELRWYFGPGLWTYRIALDDIRSVGIVRNHWWNGFGIRQAPGRSLYNVSGLDAVEIVLKSGDIRRIGTDDPQGLTAALKQAGRGG
ncbi:MAG TPA: hypothetical protein VKS24_23095 [Bradyrhizobium sp.]|nr:hypothetical protein [Bradyrhizobium sp.]